MKKVTLIMFAVTLVGGSTFVSCTNEAAIVPNPETKNSTITNKSNLKTKSENSEVYFGDIDEFLDYFDALYVDGDESTIVQTRDGIVILESTSENPPATYAHDFETTHKYDFARWCQRQLEAGKTLKIGKTPNGVWADMALKNHDGHL